MLHIRLLGPVQVLDGDGRDLTPAGARERLALATLALVAPTALSTERLAAELYHDRPASDPRNAVQAVISRLRRALGSAAGSVETTATGYRVTDLTVDLDGVESGLRAALAEVDADRATALLAEATAGWRGPLAEDVGPAGATVEAERTRFDGLRADAEEAVAERRLARGDGPELVADLEAAARLLPWRERRWELLMLALYRQGRQADALRAFQQARRLLGDQLGLEPGPALADLERRILAHDPSLTPDPAGSFNDHLRPGGPAARPGTGVADPAGTTTHSDSGPDGLAGHRLQPMDAPLPTGTLALLLCDVERSGAGWDADPADVAARAGLRDRVAQAASTTGGRLVTAGPDGVMAVFPTVAAALAAAAAVVDPADDADPAHATPAHAAPAPDRSSVAPLPRLAVHAGTMAPEADTYRGPVVAHAARLLEIGHGGQILVSGPAAELARVDLAGDPADNGAGSDRALRPLGLHWLRDTAEPAAVHQLTGPSLRVAFPPLRTATPASLPRPRTALLGRDQLLAEVSALVDTHPLVTLVGPGGMGKTSLALAAAWAAAGRRPVTFVDLAPVADPATVAVRVADEVAPADGADDRSPTQRLTDRLRAAPDLVVVDNAEHLLDPVAALLDAVLAHELKGSLLVTSRQPLGLTGELVVSIPPLDLPATDDDLDLTGRSPSVRLFCERAGAARVDGTAEAVPPGLLPVVAHICRRLDGVPLAIELAAGRTAVLSLADIAARLDDQLRLLRQTRTSRAQRHRSLEAVVGWSVDQLSPPARRLFTALSVMAGGFDLPAVEALAARCGLDPLGVLDDLDELVGASLLAPDDRTGRFRMLEPIRQVAEALLDASGEADRTRRAHLAWLADLAAEASARRTTGPGAYEQLGLHAAQLRAALAWAAESGHADAAASLAFDSSWWFLTHDLRSGTRLLARLLEVIDRSTNPLGWAEVVLANAVVTATQPFANPGLLCLEALPELDRHGHPSAVLARVAAAFSQVGQADLSVPLALLAEAEAATAEGDDWNRAVVDIGLMAMQRMATQLGTGAFDLPATIARGQWAAQVFRQRGERWALGVALGELGRLHHLTGTLEEAEACYLESLELLDGSDYHGAHYFYTSLGQLASDRGHHDRAERYHRRSLEIAEIDGEMACRAFALGGLAEAVERRGDPTAARALYLDALAALADADSNRDALMDQHQTLWQAAVERLTAS